MHIPNHLSLVLATLNTHRTILSHKRKAHHLRVDKRDQEKKVNYGTNGPRVARRAPRAGTAIVVPRTAGAGRSTLASHRPAGPPGPSYCCSTAAPHHCYIHTDLQVKHIYTYISMSRWPRAVPIPRPRPSSRRGQQQQQPPQHRVYVRRASHHRATPLLLPSTTTTSSGTTVV